MYSTKSPSPAVAGEGGPSPEGLVGESSAARRHASGLMGQGPEAAHAASWKMMPSV